MHRSAAASIAAQTASAHAGEEAMELDYDDDGHDGPATGVLPLLLAVIALLALLGWFASA
ncbi:MAG TPA: hypothetical protein VK043_14435 [Burkholderiales bacterium]|nr:hypothetical protein [Burkholderiales bacterium]